MKNIFIFSLIFFLTGCKVEIELPVKLSDFDTKGKAVRVTGAMAVEVASCNKQGSQMPSDDIFKLQKQIPYVFKGAEYIQCNKYQLKSYALFKLPANIDNVQDGKAVDEQVINLAYFPNETGARDLTVYIPPKLKNSINELVKSNVYISSSDILISLIIDSEGKSLSFTVIGAYIDKKPVQLEKYDSNGDKFMITIPSYGLEKMLGQSDEAFIVLVNVKQKK